MILITNDARNHKLVAVIQTYARGLFVVPDLIRDPFAEYHLLEMDSGSRDACPE